MPRAFTTRVIPDHDPFVEIVGLDRDTLEDEAVGAELRALWRDHGVMVFRGIDSAETHVRLSRCFGPFQVHPIKQPDTDPEHLELTNIRASPGGDGGAVYEINGARKTSWLPLHFDLVYVDKVNHGGLLRPLVIPETGGGTKFLDKIALYDSLPEELKRKAEGLEVYYQFSMDFPTQRFLIDERTKIYEGFKYRDIQSRAHTYPRSIHPLVYAQPGTGRKMLNLSPWFADGIVGMDSTAAEPLLAELCAHVQRSTQIYTHRWTPGDLVLWDNWRILHGAEGMPPECSRHLQRTTIAGDYGLGRLENDAVYVRELVDV